MDGLEVAHTPLTLGVGEPSRRALTVAMQRDTARIRPWDGRKFF